MTTPPVDDVTRWLLAWGNGDPDALDRLLPIVYAELRRIAHARMRVEPPNHTLQTTALVNEAYVRLVEGAGVSWRDRRHFYAICARLMRRILVDRARARAAQKRQTDPIAGDARPGEVSLSPESMLALDHALQRLANVDARKADVVVMRYFGGLTVEETAAAMGISAETVMRDWKVARLWLRRELKD